MKTKLTSLTLICLTAIFAGGCATPYIMDRNNDAADIFTTTLTGGVGARTRLGPIHTGLNITLGEIGLRGGVIQENGGGPCRPFTDIELLGFAGHEPFRPHDIIIGNKERGKLKAFDTGESFIPFFYPELEVYDPDSTNRLSDPSFTNMLTHPFMTQVEVQCNFLFGFRLGFNAGELMDFILGWTTLDIYGDDISGIRAFKSPSTGKE